MAGSIKGAPATDLLGSSCQIVEGVVCKDMSEEKFDGNTLNFACEKGQVLLHGLFKNAVVDHRINEAMKAFQNTSNALEQAQDDRALAVVYALAVEGALDRAIRAFCPGYDRLVENRDVTFSVKVEILESLALIPPHILRAIEPVRQIRNEFGHNLEITRFNDLQRKRLASIDSHLEKLTPGFNRRLGTKERLRTLTGTIVLALLLFSHQIMLLREYIESAEFRKGFADRYPSSPL